MKTGSLEGFVDRTWQVVHDSGELGAAVTSYTISGIDGDTDVKYRLISRVVNGYNGASSCLCRINNDSGANYGNQYIQGGDTTVGAGRGTTGTNFSIGYGAALARVSMCEVLLNAKSGIVRSSIKKIAYDITGTTVNYVQAAGQSWNNTADNIISLNIYSDQTSGIGIGSRFILLKEVRIASGLRTGELDILGTLKGAWQEVYRHTVAGSAETSITVSGLLGNTLDQILRVRVRAVSGSTTNTIGVRINNDSGATAYGYQQLNGNSTSASAGRTTDSGINMGYAVAINDLTLMEILLYSKTGFPRTAICESVQTISGTTVTQMTLSGHSYVEGTNATQLTSLVFVSSDTGGFGIGSEFVVERLNL